MDANGNAIEFVTFRKGSAAKCIARPNFWRSASFEEEREEVLQSVLDALAEPEEDADRLAACAGLLRGLMGRPAAQGRRSSVSRRRESRGAASICPPKRMALYATVNSLTAAPVGPGGRELANSAGVNHTGF